MPNSLIDKYEENMNESVWKGTKEKSMGAFFWNAEDTFEIIYAGSVHGKVQGVKIHVQKNQSQLSEVINFKIVFQVVSLFIPFRTFC